MTPSVPQTCHSWVFCCLRSCLRFLIEVHVWTPPVVLPFRCVSCIFLAIFVFFPLRYSLAYVSALRVFAFSVARKVFGSGFTRALLLRGGRGFFTQGLGGFLFLLCRSNIRINQVSLTFASCKRLKRAVQSVNCNCDPNKSVDTCARVHRRPATHCLLFKCIDS